MSLSLSFVLGCAVVGVVCVVWLIDDVRRQAARFRGERDKVHIDQAIANEWRLTDEEYRAKELRLVAGRDARGNR